MMVVVPTQNDVSLNFGWSMLDVVAYLLTIAGVVVLVRWRRTTVSRHESTAPASDN
jgi:hypothetical protein